MVPLGPVSSLRRPSFRNSMPRVKVRSADDDGVQGLLARDRKEPKLAPELDVRFEPEPTNKKEREAAAKAKVLAGRGYWVRACERSGVFL